MMSLNQDVEQTYQSFYNTPMQPSVVDTEGNEPGVLEILV